MPTSRAAEFIPKPLRASHLLDAIDRHVAGQAAQSTIAIPPKAEERAPLAIVDTPALDPDVLVDLTKLSSDPTFVDRLLRGFLSDTSRLVEEISSALTQRSYEAAKDGAHALKGGSASVGASQLTQIATRIEKSSHDTLRLRSAQLIEDLVQSASRAANEVERFLEQRKQNAGS